MWGTDGARGTSAMVRSGEATRSGATRRELGGDAAEDGQSGPVCMCLPTLGQREDATHTRQTQDNSSCFLAIVRVFVCLVACPNIRRRSLTHNARENGGRKTKEGWASKPKSVPVHQLVGPVLCMHSRIASPLQLFRFSYALYCCAGATEKSPASPKPDPGLRRVAPRRRGNVQSQHRRREDRSGRGQAGNKTKETR